MCEYSQWSQRAVQTHIAKYLICFIYLTVSVVNWPSYSSHNSRHDIKTFAAEMAFSEWTPSVTGELHSQRASGAELWCFYYYQPGVEVEQSRLLVIWDTMRLIWRHCNGGLIKTIVGVIGTGAWVNTDYRIATIDVNGDPEARILLYVIRYCAYASNYLYYPHSHQCFCSLSNMNSGWQNFTRDRIGPQTGSTWFTYH